MTPPPIPKVEQTFLARICTALGTSPRDLAKTLGVSYKNDIAPLLHPRHLVAEIDRDEVWMLLARHVDERTAMLLAIRFEMTKALATDRNKRAVRIATQRARDKKGSPRG